MNKYVVAHFSLVTSKQTQRLVLANSILEATQKYARAIGKTIGENDVPTAVCPDDWFTAIKIGNASSGLLASTQHIAVPSERR